MNRHDTPLSLFLRCLDADYIHTPEGGDYALQLDKNCLYLLFEWSDGREDWHHNLTFSAKKVNPDAPKEQQWRAHRGFLKVWNAMKSDVLDKIADITVDHPIRSLTCVGYSHGAALALLATQELSRKFGQQIPVEGYGFGSPRVIWGGLPRSVGDHLKNFHTLRNRPDLVTHLPPAILGFRHINLQVWGEKGKYGPIEAHTSQAYIQTLKQGQENLSAASSTRSAVSLTNTSKSRRDKWFFRSVYSATPRR